MSVRKNEKKKKEKKTEKTKKKFNKKVRKQQLRDFRAVASTCACAELYHTGAMAILSPEPLLLLSSGGSRPLGTRLEQ